MKAYTDLEQSKRLAEFLPLDSADMRYAPFGDTHPWFIKGSLIEKDSIPCWSLDALMDILPANIVTSSNIANTLHVTYHMDMYKREDHKWIINYERERMYTFGLSLFHTFNVDFVKDLGSVELIDTAYNTIITLHNNKIL